MTHRPLLPDEDVRLEIHSGSRDELRTLFERPRTPPPRWRPTCTSAGSSVAERDGEVIGHLQLVDIGPACVELKNMAVREAVQGCGVGRRLVRAAVELAAAGSATEMVVATAAADLRNLRFYQRQGFRMGSIERDAFSAATGYPPGIRIDGINLRDRVWLDRSLDAESPR